MVDFIREFLLILDPWTEYTVWIIGGSIGLILALVFGKIGFSPAQKAGAAWYNSFLDNCFSFVILLVVGVIMGAVFATLFMLFTN